MTQKQIAKLHDAVEAARLRLAHATIAADGLADDLPDAIHQQLCFAMEDAEQAYIDAYFAYAEALND